MVLQPDAGDLSSVLYVMVVVIKEVGQGVLHAVRAAERGVAREAVLFHSAISVRGILTSRKLVPVFRLQEQRIVIQ
jgi:hypothetical protein